MFRWKNKNVSEKVYLQRVSQSQRATEKARKHREQVLETENASPSKRKREVSEAEENNDSKNASAEETPVNLAGNAKFSTSPTSNNILEGRRIVEFAHIAKEMWCKCCKEALSFEYIVDELRRGLGSILTVRCHKCLFMNQVTTGKQHKASGRVARFDVNSKVILGGYHNLTY